MVSFVHGRLRSFPARGGLAARALSAAAAVWLLLALSAGGAPGGTTAGLVPGGSSAGLARGGTGAGSAPATPAGPAEGPAAHMSGSLAAIAAADPTRSVQVIIQLQPGVAPSRGSALVRSVGGQPGPGLHIINGLSARLAAGAARRLAASALVRAVSLNAVLQATDEGDTPSGPASLVSSFDSSVGAPRLWRHATGAGVGVAVIDTGITGDLPDFRTSPSDSTSRVATSVVINPNATTAQDTYGHGTAVAGLVAGNGGDRDPSDPLAGKYAGTAPAASLVSIKIGDDTGQATTLDAIYGLQFAVDHQREDNIRVVNMSFRSTSAESYRTDPLDAAAEQAWLQGIVVVVAAGNLGSAPDAVSYAPGNDPYVLTVGAADDQGTRWRSDDQQTSWSSQGTTQDGFAKPDVLAPGAHIVSTLAPGSSFASLCPSCVVGGSYFQVSGTSLAAPIVAGIAADLLGEHPDWTPDMVKGAIVNTAQPLSGGGNEIYGPAADSASDGQLVSNQGLTPSTLIDPASGSIDYTHASWSMGSWSAAAGPLSASWSSASWSCADCSSGGSGSVSPTSASWSTVGWSTFWG